jgi:DNA-binding transcriptional LysR family regulator
MKFSSAQIEAFLALESTLRFASAAERCCVSASAFSQIISRLEEEVGAKLFDRDTRNVCLTPEGEIFAHGARRIAAEINTSVSELRDRIAGRSGQVVMASTPSLCARWLPSLMKRFRSEHPNITLKLHDTVSERCLELLREGHVDFCLVGQQGDSFEFESTPLFDEPFYLVCRHDDPLAGHSSLKLKQLKGRDFIQMVGTGSVWMQRKIELREAGIRDTGIEVSNVSTLTGLIAAGFGIGLIAHIQLPLYQGSELVVRPISDKTFKRSFFLVTRRGRSLSIAAGNMSKFIINDSQSLGCAAKN